MSGSKSLKAEIEVEVCDLMPDDAKPKVGRMIDGCDPVV